MSSLANNYNRRNISFKYGKVVLYSTSGKKYLDFVQGIANSRTCKYTTS